jgi:hypothetical protein
LGNIEKFLFWGENMVFVLIVLIFAHQMAFAEKPRNVIAFDFGPTLVSMIFEDTEEAPDGEKFGILISGYAGQYERQMFDEMSLGLRFAHLESKVKMGFDGDDIINARLGVDFSAYALEGHVRWYPFNGSLFSDFMLGYANMSTVFSGSVIVMDIRGEEGDKIKESVSYTTSRGYIKYGAKAGWRIDFGKPGGLIFEFAVGQYYVGAKFGDAFGKQLAERIDKGISDIGLVSDIILGFEDKFFIGGQRATLGVGWRF